jgi:ketosteroid isomerase-like protein
VGTNERKQAVRDLLTAYAASDAEALRRLLAEDVVWWVPQSAAGRYPRPIVGREALIEVLAGPSRAYRKPTIAWTVHDVIAEGDVVMATASMTAELISGVDYANDYSYAFRFTGDRIAEGTEYTDTAYAVERSQAPAPEADRATSPSPERA